MTFPGRFADSLVADKLEALSVSFLVSDLEVRRGGVAANIAFGLGLLGHNPVLVGAVGEDFDDYRSWLDRHGVDTSHVHVTDIGHTARFTCTTDEHQNQIASFYPGAMSAARDIELGPIAERLGGIGLVHIGANDPEAMARHTDECRNRSIPFAADPSQQLTSMTADQIDQLVTGSAYLFSNEYEASLIQRRTGWSEDEVLKRCEVRVTTRGGHGIQVQEQGSAPIDVPVVPALHVADPTGVGDAFRAGFLAARAWGHDLRLAAQTGAALATLVVETVGTQEYAFDAETWVARYESVYGEQDAAVLAEALRA